MPSVATYVKMSQFVSHLAGFYIGCRHGGCGDWVKCLLGIGE